MRYFSLPGLGLAATGALLCAGAAQATVKDGVDAWQAGNFDKAIAQWRGPAEAGDADAQFDLAQAYKLGRGVPPDMAVAQRWYEKAAQQGHEQAQANLGLILFQNGDRAAAMPWIQKAAARGEPRAQYVLGTAHFNGDLAPKDWPRAYALMTRAAAAGLPQAKNSLAEMDKYIPLGDRQQGLALASSMSKAQPAGTGNVLVRPELAAAAPPPVRQVPPPPPRPAQLALASPLPAAVRPVPVPPASPPPPAGAAAPPPAKPAARPAPPRTAPATAPAAGGGWRVQLGAFGTAAAAKAAWGSFGGIAGLSSVHAIYEPAGAITRLKAGPFPDKAAAERACAAAKGAGKSCFPVAP